MTPIFGLCLLLIFPGMLEAQEKDPYAEDIARFREFVRQQMEVDQIPGLSVGFYKGDYQWTEGFGYIDLENEVPATPQSAYRLASVSKSMTAVAILQLQEAGKLSIDDPVKKYVPYFPRKRWDITIRQLMGHLGGISHYRNYDEEGHIKIPKDTREAIEIFEDFELVAKPGTEYHYSSYGYNLLGAVVEGAAEQPYGKYLQEHLWDPLNMDHTWMDDPDRIIPNRPRGYRLDFGELKHSEYVDISSRFAAGGTRSTVADMLRYARGLQEGKLLSPGSTRMMETTMNTANGRRTDYGMGWHIEPVNGHFQAYHTGGQPETRTMLMRFPAEDMAIALAYNLEGGSLRAIARRLYQLVMDEGWNGKPYTGNSHDEALTRGMWDIYNFGMAYYKHRDKPRNTDPEEMQQMFEFLNNTLHPEKIQQDEQTVKQKIALGRHPRAQTAYVRIGSYMAHKLAEKHGSERLEYYHTHGAPVFFTDYLRLTPEEGNRWPVNEAMVQKIKRYRQDWSQTWNAYTRQLYIGSWKDLGTTLERLKQQARGKKIYPDYTSSLANALFDHALHEGAASTLPLVNDFIELYPESAVPYVTRGHVHIIRGDKKEAEEAYRRAWKTKVDRQVASAAMLNQHARQLFNRNRLEEALDLIEVASKIYPEHAHLRHTRGDIFLEKSRRSYQQALELDPTLQDARQELDGIGK